MHVLFKAFFTLLNDIFQSFANHDLHFDTNHFYSLYLDSFLQLYSLLMLLSWEFDSCCFWEWRSECKNPSDLCLTRDPIGCDDSLLWSIKLILFVCCLLPLIEPHLVFTTKWSHASIWTIKRSEGLARSCAASRVKFQRESISNRRCYGMAVESITYVERYFKVHKGQ